LVDKKDLKIVDKKIARQEFQLTRQGEKRVPRHRGSKQKLPDKRIVELAKICQKIEGHYRFPQDIEWALSKDKLWIVQTRPVTTIEMGSEKWEVREDVVDEKVLLTGTGASPGVAVGPVKIVPSARQIGKVKDGDVLVTSMTNPDFVPAMKKAAAIVTDKGGRTSHAAIVSRELGIPCVVGTRLATSMLRSGEVVTVDGSSGKVYQGKVSPQEMRKISNLKSQISKPISNLKTATKLYVNLSEPEAAAKVAAQNVDGVGLLRSEFVMAKIGVHPRKLIDDGKSKIFVDELAEMVSQFCRAFTPRSVVYRANDFKTSEYRNLKGGKKYEAEEANPFIGFRGALRYITDDDVFRLELRALKQVKNKMDFRNLILMVPFVRTVPELEKVKEMVVGEGLRRSSRFKLWMMVEVPSNVVILEDFAKVGIDGVSIGSNDLTMLTLGVDRDNEKISAGFDELNPAVLWMLERTIKKCHKLGLTSSICGQAPSDYPELTRQLVKWGITSISVNPDVIPQTRQLIYEAEKEIVSKK
jgi:pyruvate,water dikinase